jgi:hypothetical protein
MYDAVEQCSRCCTATLCSTELHAAESFVEIVSFKGFCAGSSWFRAVQHLALRD